MYSEKLNLNFLNFKNFGEIKIGNFKKKIVLVEGFILDI